MKKLLTILLLFSITACTPKETMVQPPVTVEEKKEFNLLYTEGNTFTCWKGEDFSTIIALEGIEEPTQITVTLDSEEILCDATIIQTTLATDLENITRSYYDIVTDKTNTDTDTLALLKIKVPNDAQPGTYNGSVLLNEHEFPYTLTIIDRLLENTFDAEFWQYPYSAARYYGDEHFDDNHKTYLTNAYLPSRELGGNVVTVSICDEPWGNQVYDAYPAMIKWIKSNGYWYFDFSDFDEWINLMQQDVMIKKILSFSILPSYNRIGFYDEELGSNQSINLEPGSEDWYYIWGIFLDNYIYHLDELGLFDITYIAMDEKHPEYLEDVLNLLNNHPNQEGKTFNTTCYFNYSPLKYNFLDEIEDISLAESILQENPQAIQKLAEERTKKGLQTSMYTCTYQYPNSFTFSDPEESTWTILYAYANNMTGFIRWAYDAFTEDPLVTTDNDLYESGDTLLVYPGDNHQVYTSVRLEKIKKGYNLVNKLKQLEPTDLLQNISNSPHSIEVETIKQQINAIEQYILENE